MRLMNTALLILGGAAATVQAQQPAAPAPAATQLFTSSAEVTALMARAKSELKPGQPMTSLPILQLAPYRASLEYRVAVGPASIHEKDAEMFYVIDGAGTIVTGGALTEEKRTNPDNRGGTGIQGGASRRIAKGDFVMVPENTAHWFSAIDGTLVLMSLHVPHGAAH